MKQLYNQQLNAIAKLRNYKVGALFMDAGTGKTRVACELINSLWIESGSMDSAIDGSKVDMVVWVGPLRSIRPDEGLPSVVDEVKKWIDPTLPISYYGVESIQSSDRIYLEVEEKIRTGGRVFLIMDESIKIKNFDAKRTKRLLHLSGLAEYRLILNGTPITRNLLDVWSQFEFLSPKILNMSLAEFKNTFCEYTTVTKFFGGKKGYTKEFITGYENIDFLYSLIGHYIYECDLELNVKQRFSNYMYEVDKEAREEYTRLKEKYLDDEMLQWKNNNIFLEMTQKMQHAYCTTESKFKALDVHFKRYPEDQHIIFCKFIVSRIECKRRYPKATILSYQKESLSLNLQHFPYAIYFDKLWDYALRYQAGRRNYRLGQEFDCQYWDLTGDVGLEDLIDINISKKVNQADYFRKISMREEKEIRKELSKVL